MKQNILYLTFRYVLLYPLLFISSTVMAETASRGWRFAVLLGDDPIGEHIFKLEARSDSVRVRSEANMQVKFLFFDAFKYEHSATEIWKEGCLVSINSQTEKNNEQIQVSGRAKDEYFQVQTSDENLRLQGCVRSFAYWDPAKLLDSEYLFNAQTGELMPVNVELGQLESIQAAGLVWQAQRVSISGEKLNIDLWYGPGGEWLRLRSELPNGRELNYQLIEGPHIPSMQQTVEQNNLPDAVDQAANS